MKHFWREWRALWATINSYYTTWVSYALVILGGAMTYWEQIDDYIPARWRGATYAAIGLIVLVTRARRDIKAAAVRLVAPDPAP